MGLEGLVGKVEIVSIKSYRAVFYPIYAILNLVNMNKFGCIYTPSCSHYMEEAIKEWGAYKGTVLGIKRVARCNIHNPGGSDPVPKRD